MSLAYKGIILIIFSFQRTGVVSHSGPLMSKQMNPSFQGQDGLNSNAPAALLHINIYFKVIIVVSNEHILYVCCGINSLPKGKSRRM